MVETKQVPLSGKILEVVNERLENLGINFPEYIRMLIMQESGMVNTPVEYLTEAEEKSIQESIVDYENGKYTTLKNPKEINAYFTKLNEEIDAKNI